MSSARGIFTGLAWLAALTPLPAAGDPVTLSGIVSYDGPYSAETLYLAVLDTTGSDLPIYAVKAYTIPGPPFSQAFSFVLDNAFAPPVVWIAALLDVDGGGFASIGEFDIFGWFDGGSGPTLVSTATSRTNLEFLLPTAEVHGDVIFAPEQTSAEVWISPDPGCADPGVTRPGVVRSASGAYSLIGIYPGTYCLYAYGEGGPSVPPRTCFGDLDCQTHALITLEDHQVRLDADLHFTVVNPALGATWGRIKSRYR